MCGFSYLTLAVFAGCGYAAVLNIDYARYQPWQRVNGEPQVRIPVFIDTPRYDATAQANIRSAMTKLNGDLTNCIQFYEVTTKAFLGRDFINVSPVDKNGVAQPTCQAVPGRVVSQLGNGQTINILPGSAAGQCSNSVRQIMGKFANVLGLRNEYKRADRPITTDVSKIDPSISAYGADMYSTYPLTTSLNTSPFDYNSITMISPDINAASGQTMFTVPSGAVIGTQERLSQQDCMAIAARHGCSPANCQNPYG